MSDWGKLRLPKTSFLMLCLRTYMLSGLRIHKNYEDNSWILNFWWWQWMNEKVQHKGRYLDVIGCLWNRSHVNMNLLYHKDLWLSQRICIFISLRHFRKTHLKARSLSCIYYSLVRVGDPIKCSFNINIRFFNFNLAICFAIISIRGAFNEINDKKQENEICAETFCELLIGNLFSEIIYHRVENENEIILVGVFSWIIFEKIKNQNDKWTNRKSIHILLEASNKLASS